MDLLDGLATQMCWVVPISRARQFLRLLMVRMLLVMLVLLMLLLVILLLLLLSIGHGVAPELFIAMNLGPIRILCRKL